MAFGIDDAIAAGLKILNKFVPDPEARAEAEQQLRDGLLSWDRAQTEINKAEAMHRSIFVAGWRPWIGWICGLSLFYHAIVLPLILLWVAVTGTEVPLPDFDNTLLTTVLMGMLGFGGLRTYEKLKGVTK